MTRQWIQVTVYILLNNRAQEFATEFSIMVGWPGTQLEFDDFNSATMQKSQMQVLNAEIILFLNSLLW